MSLRSSAHPTPSPRLAGQGIRIASLKPWIGGLCLVASLGAHGLLLGLPWSPGAGGDQESAPLEEPPVSMVPVSIDVAVLPAPVADPEPEIPSPVPIPVPSPVAPSLATPPPAPPPAAVTAPASIPVAPDPIPAPIPEPIPAPPLAPAEPAPVEEPLALAPPPPVEEPVPPPPYADFPHIQEAQRVDCGVDLCWRSPVEGSWRGAAQSLRADLEAQGYILDDITDEVLSTETGVRVYHVAKAGEAPYYLNLVSVDEEILYSLTPAPLTQEMLVALQAF